MAHAAMPKQKIKGETAWHQTRRWTKARMKSQAYRQSQKMRTFIEPVIGWIKNIGSLSRTRFIGHERIQNDAMLAASAWNLLRMTRLAGKRDDLVTGSPVRNEQRADDQSIIGRNDQPNPNDQPPEHEIQASSCSCLVAC